MLTHEQRLPMNRRARLHDRCVASVHPTSGCPPATCYLLRASHDSQLDSESASRLSTLTVILTRTRNLAATP